MLLPTKHLPLKDSLLMAGGTLLGLLRTPRTVSNLWAKSGKFPEIGTFDRFSLALDFLFALDLVSFDNGLIVRRKP